MEQAGLVRPTDGELDSFRALVRSRTGIYYPPRKNFVLEARIQKLMRLHGAASVEELLRALTADENGIWNASVRAFTTNHTFFFRESEHFDRLIEEIRKRSVSNPAIWDAASSTGEEVYSMAMALIEAGIRDYRIMASDIDIWNLKILKRARYPENRVRTVPDRLLARYFSKLDRRLLEAESGGRGDEDGGEDVYEVLPFARERIVARRLNLSEPLRFRERFDFVFCRNVLMYFQPEMQRQVVAMLAENLKPQGILFVGHSETLFGYEGSFQSLEVGAYRKRRTA